MRLVADFPTCAEMRMHSLAGLMDGIGIAPESSNCGSKRNRAAAIRLRQADDVSSRIGDHSKRALRPSSNARNCERLLIGVPPGANWVRNGNFSVLGADAPGIALPRACSR